MNARIAEANAKAEAVARMNAEGMNDTEIAKAIGCTQWTVGYHRRKLGLGRAEGAHTKARIDRVRALVNQKLTDDEIAAAMGCSKSNVRAMRFRHGIKSQSRRRKSPQRQENEAQITKLVAEGLTDLEIAARIGVSVDHTSRLRRGLGLAFNPSPNKPASLKRAVYIPAPKPKPKPHPMLAEIAARKSRLVAEGFTEQQALRAVAHQMGVQL